MRHGSEASSIGRVISLRHSDLAVFNYFQFSSVQFTVPERCTRSYAANVFSVQFSANGSDGCHSHRVVSDLQRSHSCLVSSSISSSGTGHPGHWSRKPVVVHLQMWRIPRISRRRMRLFHFTPLVSARQQAAAAATSSCQPS